MLVLTRVTLINADVSYTCLSRGNQKTYHSVAFLCTEFPLTSVGVLHNKWLWD